MLSSFRLIVSEQITSFKYKSLPWQLIFGNSLVFFLIGVGNVAKLITACTGQDVINGILPPFPGNA